MRRLAGSEFWTYLTERALTNRFQTAFRIVSKASHVMIRGCVMFYICRMKPKGNMEVYRVNDGRQDLQFCIHTGTLLAASGVRWSRFRYL